MDEITCIAEYIRQVEEKVNEININNDKIVVYRGEPRAYEIPGKPGIFREDYLEKEPFFEKNLLNEMKVNRITSGKTWLECAVDAQHDEFPSRLLDVTYNALVALYFAVTPYYKRNEEDSYDKKYDGQVIIYFLPHMYCAGADNLEYAFENIINRSSENDGFLLKSLAQENYKLIDHIKMNTRICVQQGAFIMFQGDEYAPISNKDYVTIKISKDYRKKLREELNTLFGINTGFIYPEPYNLCSTMGEKAYKIINTEISIETELNSFFQRIKGEIEYYFRCAITCDKKDKNHKTMVTQIIMNIEEMLMKYRQEFIEYAKTYYKSEKDFYDRFNNIIDIYEDYFTFFDDKYGIKISIDELQVTEEDIKKKKNKKNTFIVL